MEIILFKRFQKVSNYSVFFKINTFTHLTSQTTNHFKTYQLLNIKFGTNEYLLIYTEEIMQF